MKFKFIAILVAAVIAFAGIAVFVSNDEGIETGDKVRVNGWTWTVQGNIATQVSGSGWALSAEDWPEGVTMAGMYQTEDSAPNLSYIEIGDNITTYASELHRVSKNVDTLVISASVSGMVALYGCPNLTEVTVDPNNTTFRVENNMLLSSGNTVMWIHPDIYNQTDIDWSKSNISSIGQQMFLDAVNLRSIKLPEKMTSWDGGIFNGCTSLESIVIPKGITDLPTDQFINCSSLSSVTFKGEIKNIGAAAFQNCTALTSITIPDSVKIIGQVAFMNSGLTSVDIPESVTDIQRLAFADCNSLEYAIVPETATVAADAFPAHTIIIPKLGFDSYPTADMIIRQVANMQYEFSTTTAGKAIWSINEVTLEGSAVEYNFETAGDYKVTLTIYDENDKITHKTERVISVSSDADGDNDDTGSNSHNGYAIGVAASAFFAAICFAGYLLVPGARRNKIVLIAGIALALIAIALALIGGLL